MQFNPVFGCGISFKPDPRLDVQVDKEPPFY